MNIRKYTHLFLVQILIFISLILVLFLLDSLVLKYFLTSTHSHSSESVPSVDELLSFDTNNLKPYVGSSLLWNLKSNPVLVQDTRYLYRVIKNKSNQPIFGHGGINKDGLRGNTLSSSKKSNLNIIIIGDSCSFGWKINDLEKTWPYLLEAKLKHDYPEANVVNLGQPGHSTLQTEIFFKDHIDDLAPSIVIFYGGWNDIWPSKLFTDRELLNLSENFIIKALKGTNFYKIFSSRQNAPLITESMNSSGEQIRVSSTEMLEGMKLIYDKVNSLGADFIIVPLLMAHFNKFSLESATQRNSMVRDTFKDKKVDIVSISEMTPTIPKSNTFFIPDGYHPNDLGSRVIADRLAELILNKLKGTKRE